MNSVPMDLTMGVFGPDKSTHQPAAHERNEVAAMTAVSPAWDGKIVLENGSGEVLSQNYPLKKAVRLLVLEKAVIIDFIEDKSLGEWLWPKVIRLKNYIYIPWHVTHGQMSYSKRRVLLRDNYTCAYCGAQATTVDHVHPRSKGGKNTWENVVAACLNCNHAKRNRTPEEAGMKLLRPGFVPLRADVQAR